jgi:alpha-1,2-mannosyltransferase
MKFSVGSRPAPATHEEDPSVQAQAEKLPAGARVRFAAQRLPRPPLVDSGWKTLAVLFFALSLAAYLADQAIHRHAVLTWYDLNVYNDAGLLTRQLPSYLYVWELKVGVQFTYTPFAALIFAGGSFLPMMALRWLMTDASIVAIPLTAWLTLGALGRRGTGRLAVALAVSALALWTEPVVKALFLGQIEPLLMLLVVWDLTRPDARKWKGVGIGVAAGIKLVPLIFIPYLLLAGKFRQAAVAAGTFAATFAIGFAALPGPSVSYWLTGYFMRPGRTGSVHSLVNQSLLGMLARSYGSVSQAQGPWVPLSLAVAAVGLVAGAMLSRTGRPVQGWTLVGITGVLVSPISWDHHWIWIVPFLALLAGLAMTARPLARAGYVLTIIAIAGVIGSWPWRYSGPRAWVPRRGLLGWFVRPPKTTQIMVVHGWQVLTWNLWVAVGSVLYLALIVTAVVSWRNRQRPEDRPVDQQDEPTRERQKRHERPERLVPIAAGTGSIEGLLARADAVLRADHRASEPGQDGQLCEGVGVGENGLSGRNGQTADRVPADGHGALATRWRADADASTDGSASRPGGSPRPARTAVRRQGRAGP